ncbi:TPA: hypothetical protein QDB07_000763 [Burkholderia vietnamiensis]|nr:hypothetical protein [Burkholderia vietnamiensis]
MAGTKEDEDQIPPAVLRAAFSDRSKLSDDVLITTAQLAMLLNRKVRTLEEDRKKGLPPPFKKPWGERGGVRYRIGTIRDMIANLEDYNSTLEASIALSFGEFLDTAGPNDRWPFLIHQGTPIDFFKSLGMGDAVTDEDTAVMLTLDDYLTKRKEAAWAQQAARERDDVTAFADAETPQDLPSLKDVKPNGGRL